MQKIRTSYCTVVDFLASCTLLIGIDESHRNADDTTCNIDLQVGLCLNQMKTMRTPEKHTPDLPLASHEGVEWTTFARAVNDSALASSLSIGHVDIQILEVSKSLFACMSVAL